MESTTATSAREEAILRFYEGLAGELRGPINALSGWTEVLAAAAPGSQAAEVADAMRFTLGHLRRLCDDARDSAAVALGHLELRPQPVDLAAIVDAAVACHPLRSARYVSSGPVVVDGDRERLTQVVDSVLSAVTTAGGMVRIALRAVDPWAELTMTNDRPISFEVMRDLFEPFSRRPGEGPGLYVCRALVMAHGGEIGARADDGADTLWMRLPLSK